MTMRIGTTTTRNTQGELPRFFTVAEANRTLPLVRRIVRDILDAYPPFQKRLERFHELAANPALPDVRAQIEQLREQIDEESARINAYIRELHQIGCQFKGFDDGLVDFHSLHEGRPILLCWKLDEERIGWWHEVEEGYAGRQPLRAEMDG